MIEIIVLIILCRKIGNLAVQKGLKSLPWRFYTVIAWIIAEFAGMLLAIGLFGKDNLVGILSLGVMGGFGGYLIIRATLEKLPDSLDKDINRIGIEDLGPKKK